jgi:hypothetical protein
MAGRGGLILLLARFARQVLDRDADGFEECNGVLDSVGFSVKDLLDVAEVDQSLGTLNAGQVRDKDPFFNQAGSIAIDDRIFLGVQAAAVARLIAIAPIVEPGGIAVVTNGEDFSEIGAGDDSTHLQAMAGGSLCQGEGEIQINLFKGGPNPRLTHSENPLKKSAGEAGRAWDRLVIPTGARRCWTLRVRGNLNKREVVLEFSNGLVNVLGGPVSVLLLKGDAVFVPKNLLE